MTRIGGERTVQWDVLSIDELQGDDNVTQP